MIAVLHAYSRTNAGDGLLVDLTLARLGRLGVKSDECVVVALDPTSFADLPTVIKAGTAGRSVDAELAAAGVRAAGVALSTVAPRMARGRLAQALREADAFVAVGGGYLRTGTRVNAIGTGVNHLPQLLAASRSAAPSVYLPQSVGPLAGPIGRLVATALGGIGVVHVRDDRSRDELAELGNVERTPDLAVLDLAERAARARPRDASGPPVIVARDLGDPPGYHEALHALAHQLGDAVWGVQTEGAEAKSDRAFYERIGVEPAGRVEELLASGAVGPVVSVRLHGAMQALLAGLPAIHLGYERKSTGAYRDLGLEPWLHPARRFDAALVASQVDELRADASAYWERFTSRRPALCAASAALDRSVASVLDRG